MTLNVTVTWRSLTKTPTVYQVLKNKLGREPSDKELSDDVRRILCEAAAERKGG
jgi:hypothetical protein